MRERCGSGWAQVPARTDTNEKVMRELAAYYHPSRSLDQILDDHQNHHARHPQKTCYQGRQGIDGDVQPQI